jgi:archaellum component FlaF (FlaF/FlaG flagellin family)
MARPVRVTVGSVASSAVIPLNTYGDPFNVGIGCDVSAGGSLTYTVQHTFDNVQSPTFNPATATWFSNSTIVAQTTDKDGNYAYPVTAVRLTVTAWTSGTVTMTVIQAGY